MAHYIVTIELLDTPKDTASRFLLNDRLHAAMKNVGYTHEGGSPRATYVNRLATEQDVHKEMARVRDAVRSVHKTGRIAE